MFIGVIAHIGQALETAIAVCLYIRQRGRLPQRIHVHVFALGNQPGAEVDKTVIRTAILLDHTGGVPQAVLVRQILIGLQNVMEIFRRGMPCLRVKIDAFAYLPVQDFGNAFSIFLAQNYGAQEKGRLKQGMRGAFAAAAGFSVAVSAVVYGFAAPLMRIFIDAGEMDVIAEGVRYLHIEGAFYLGIGWLFLLYGLYRAVGRPGMSVVLTVISLGIRVALAYTLSAIPAVGVVGIWWSVPIGWFLADAVGLGYYWWKRRTLFEMR